MKKIEDSDSHIIREAFSESHNKRPSSIDTVLQSNYQRFLDTHIESGITEGLVQEVSLTAIENLVNKKANLRDFNISPASQKALADHFTSIKQFAEQAGVEKILLTQQGTWVLPPKMRDDVSAYKNYLSRNYDQGTVMGTATITLAQNQPIPVFENGEQVGGFESGDDHGFLTIVDRRDGKVYELHQSFLENSDDPAFRPSIVSLNHELAKERGMSEQQLLDIVKSPETKLESVGMLDGRNTELAAYGCELTRDIDAASNWNNGVKGSNFNYVPMAAIEMPLCSQQLDLLLFDRELAGRECAFQPAQGCDIQDQNAPGFEPMIKDSVYPDGSPRYIMSKQEIVDGEVEVTFTNANGSEEVPEGSSLQRVKEYVTRVDPKDMQVVEPYNHWGQSRNDNFKASNCFGTCLSVLEGVAAAGPDNTVRKALGVQKTSEGGIQKALAKLVLPEAIKGRKTTLPVSGPASGEIDVYRPKDGAVTVYDFCNMPGMLKSSWGGIKNFKPQGLAGEAIENITAQRQEAVANTKRPDEDKLTLMAVGTSGNYIKQGHEKIYGPAPSTSAALNVMAFEQG